MHRTAGAVLIVVACSCGQGVPTDDEKTTAVRPPTAWRHGPAPEFGEVERLLVVWDEDLIDYQADVLASAWGAATLTLVHHPEDDLTSAFEALAARGVDGATVERAAMNVMGPWVRDYGPLVVRRSGEPVHALDFRYNGAIEDDLSTAELAGLMGATVPVTSIDLELDGGNWLSDGDGRCVSTEAFLLNNGMSSAEGRDFAVDRLGCRDVVFLSVLDGEPTGHVDMFVHLYGPGSALVGRVSRQEDALNAELLDDAAIRLRNRGFSVRRVEMPRHDDGRWRSHLNATVVNDVVLVPVYRDDRRVEDGALSEFQHVYPERMVRPVEASWVIQREGAVHCTTFTLPRLP